MIIGHTRELVNQTYEVYSKLVKHAPEYQVINFIEDKVQYKGQQIAVSTLGKIFGMMKGRGAIDLSDLKVFVLDEADDFFLDEKREKELKELHNIL